MFSVEGFRGSVSEFFWSCSVAENVCYDRILSPEPSSPKAPDPRALNPKPLKSPQRSSESHKMHATRSKKVTLDEAATSHPQLGLRVLGV